MPKVVRDIYSKAGYEIPANSDTIEDSWDGQYGKPIADFIEKHKKDVGIKFKSSTEISAFDKLNLMSGVMKWVDSSISVTYMLPETANWKDIYDFILLAHEKEVKSIAAFPDKKMYGIVTFIPFKDLAIKLIKENVSIHPQNFSSDELSYINKISGIEINDGKIVKTTAPKRPKSLECDVYHVKVTKKLDKPRTFDYLVIVGLYNGDPYECFCMENGFIDKKYHNGVLTKKNKGQYELKFEDETTIDNVIKDTTETEDALTRMISTSLRHGAQIEFVVDQLEKTEGDLWGFSKAISRCLKKYIPDGIKASGQCPSCKQENLQRIEGCISCSCGWSKCS